MKRNVFAALALAALAFSCADLFHSTDFRTLCEVDPSAAACDGGVVGDASTPPKPSHYDSCALSTSEAFNLSQRVCGWLGACTNPFGDARFGPCVVQAQLAYDCAANPSRRPVGETDALWSCLARNGAGPQQCSDVQACLFAKLPPQRCPAVSTGSFTACDGNGSRVQCRSPGGSAPAAIEPCSLSGRHCVVATASEAFCEGRAAVDAGACTGAPRCTGSSSAVASTCLPAPGGTMIVDRGVDCSNYGSRACIDSDAGPICRSNADARAAACSDAPGILTCLDGGVARTCDGTREIEVDCTRLGLACNEGADASSSQPETACAGTNPACTEADSCEGNTLRSCAFGAAHTIACAEIGLGTCVRLPPDSAACQVK